VCQKVIAIIRKITRGELTSLVQNQVEVLREEVNRRIYGWDWRGHMNTRNKLVFIIMMLSVSLCKKCIIRMCG